MAVTVVNGARFPRSKDKTAELKLKQRLSRYHAKAAEIRCNYRYWLGKGSVGKIDAAAMTALESFAFKLICAIDQNKRLPFARRISLVELAEVAETLSLPNFCDEVVRLGPRPTLVYEYKGMFSGPSTQRDSSPASTRSSVCSNPRGGSDFTEKLRQRHVSPTPTSFGSSTIRHLTPGSLPMIGCIWSCQLRTAAT